jgi:hypothetical protein
MDLQYFWFRHFFLLGSPESLALQQLVVAGLADAKAEVQEVAAATLSGLLKGLPASEADAIRSDLLKRHAALFPARRRKKTVTPAGTSCLVYMSSLSLCHVVSIMLWLSYLSNNCWRGVVGLVV